MNFNEAFDPIRALKAAWAALCRAPLPLLVGGVLLMITGEGGGGGGNLGGWQENGLERTDWEEALPLLIGIGVCVCLVGIAFFLFSSWVYVGFAHSVEEVLRTGTGGIGTVFDSKGLFGSMVLARLLVLLILLAAALPLMAVVAAGFALV